MKHVTCSWLLALFTPLVFAANGHCERIGIDALDTYITDDTTYPRSQDDSKNPINSKYFSQDFGENADTPVTDPIVLSGSELERKRTEKLQILDTEKQSSDWTAHQNETLLAPIKSHRGTDLSTGRSQQNNDRAPYAQYTANNKQITATSTPAAVTPEEVAVQQELAQVQVQMEEEPIPPQTTAPDIRKGAELLDFVEKWRKAWSSKDLQVYMDCYSHSFQSGSFDKMKWQQKKSYLNRKYEYIDVTINDIVIEQTQQEATVTFFQTYKSDQYTTSGRKTLQLVMEDDGWRIRSEY